LAGAAIKLVVGLGNPGKTYAATRHNVGYRVVDALKESGWKGADLLKPSGFMNSSGGPVAEEIRHAGIVPGQILVVCDDFMLPLGTMRIRLKGSSGGHNGLDSILQVIGSQEIPRLRLGIGPVPPGQDPADFVLTAFKKPERAPLDEMVERAVEAVKIIVDQGFESAMNQFNKKAE
jgi:PTH1 family peptidyl-tRNA hydrolase